MSVETPWSWRARAVLVVVLVLGSAFAGIWLFEETRAFAGLNVDEARRQLVEYRDQLERLTTERNELSATANAAESELNIERAAQRQLASQVKTLEAENARLKEDLAFFDSLLPHTGGAQGLAIRRFKIDQVTPNTLRYRVLIMQGGRAEHFTGLLQLVISGVQGDQNAMIAFPEDGADAGKFKLGFRHYQRLEGEIELPDGVVAKSVSARVLAKGQVRAQTSVNL